MATVCENQKREDEHVVGSVSSKRDQDQAAVAAHTFVAAAADVVSEAAGIKGKEDGDAASDLTTVGNAVTGADEVKKQKKKKKKKTAKAAGDGAGIATAMKPLEFSDGAAAAGAAGVVKGAAAQAAAAAAAEENSRQLRKLGVWKALPTGQTWPPTKPVHTLFADGHYPPGEVLQQQVVNSKKRTAAAEHAESMRLQEVDIEAMRQASECHKQVRRYVQGLARPGIKLLDLCVSLESKTKELIDAFKLERGWGFPTGCSLNHCAAHYTPNPGDDRRLQVDDICKLDFGVQVKGRIIDCAFSIAFDERFDPLIQATQDGTNVGLSHAGVDARLSEIGGYIEEAIESYEFEWEGRTYPIRSVRNLTGHSVDLYRIHAGKSVPIVKAPPSAVASNAASNLMEEGEVYAIECFASTGKGIVCEEGECSHYMKNLEAGFAPLRLKSAKDLLKVIDENFGTLAFCRRWLEDLGCTHHFMALKQLVDKNIVVPYPPLSDVRRSFTSQMEHTVFIGSHTIEVVSRGDDY